MQLSNLASLLGHAVRSEISIMFIADEVRRAYDEDVIWCDLHVLANSMHHSLFVSDSSSVLRLLVESEDRAVIAALGFPRTQASLNHSKVNMLFFSAFTQKDQYRRYLEHLGSEMGGSKRQLSDAELIGLHILSNGRIRSIAQLLTGGRSSERRTPQHPLPALGSFAYNVLSRLCEKVIGGHFNPFNGPTITESELSMLLQDYVETHASERRSFTVFLIELQERGYLRELRSGVYTFGTPSHYQALSRMTPNVFLSYALLDSASRDQLVLNSCATALEQSGIILHHCRLPGAMKSMSDHGVHKWMTLEALSVQNVNHYAVIFVTDVYLKQACEHSDSNIPSLPKQISQESIVDYIEQYVEGASSRKINGCMFEMLLLAALAEQDSMAADRILFIMTSPHKRLQLFQDPRYAIFKDKFCYRPQDLGLLASHLVGHKHSKRTLNEN